MVDKERFKGFPTRRIKPADGMAVTAQVWEEAHEYHRQHQRIHEQMLHGPGIVAGLGVVASDPPDSSVYVLPGVALDNEGRLVVVPEPVAFDLGLAHGQVYLMLAHDESRPAPDADQEDSPLYVRSQFSIEVATAAATTPAIELARLRHRDRGAALRDAGDGEHPAANEIDLRFRRVIGATAPHVAAIAVCYTGGLHVPLQAVPGKGAGLAHGANHMARYLRGCGYSAWVDDRVPLAPGLEHYTLVYMVGRDAFQLSRDEMGALYAYLQAGGALLFESCRGEAEGGEPPADASFLDLMASMGIPLKEVSPGHSLLLDPNLFGTPPPGFETREQPRVLAGEGVIFSGADYGCLWQGKRHGRPATREEIRTAMEWGQNLAAWAVARRGARQGEA